ncbi:alkaline phosphatase D family protein [Sphingobium ummariense]|uniref:Alkaline phosphatase n=1 Tax=Sphingobium ummariense RL-3 TaxID=1346791 RepID=T0IMS8_9SPHN|nr:alkaline phosphatase D family protein [Sphingobium ummariense]EQB30115.1 alkaline phosphatase [Sphingobium ummariense RL-3]
MLDRRQLLSIAAAAPLLGAPAILKAQSWFASYPFALGVTSGDPSPDGFVIWTKLAPRPFDPHGGMPMVPLPVKWEVASDDRFRTIVASGEATARPELGHSVHVEVSGLQPDRPYWYRFALGSDLSTRGRARTLPPPSASPQSLKFGVAGCQNYQDGYFTAFRHLAREDDLAFVYHYGDFIYEYAERGPDYDKDGLPVAQVRQHIGQDCFDIADYRLRYAQYLSDYDLQAARARHTWFPTFDDHEVANNWVGDIDPKGAPADVFRLRRQAALQVWYEYMPVRAAMLPRDGLITDIYREARYGDLLSIDFLDTRSFRTDQPCGDGFKTHCAGIDDPKGQVISAQEEAWLLRNLSRKQAKWNCVAQQVMMMSLDRRRYADEKEKIYNLDSWAGYEAQRSRLLARMKGLDNVVVLTGDEHQNFAGLLDDGDRTVAVEFVSTSISSGGDGSDLRAGSDRMFQNNPQLKFLNDQRGYLVCEVTPDAWQSRFMVMDRVSTPGGAIAKRATITVPRGQPGLSIA